MSRKASVPTIMAVLFLALNVSSFGETYKAAVMDLPAGATESFKKIITAVVESTGNTVEVRVVPPPRTTYLVANKEVDFSLPMLALKDPAKIKALDYDYSVAVLYKAYFVLLTNKSKPIPIEELRNGNPKGYKIEVDISQVDSWEFKGLPSSNIFASLKKVADGQIDGLLYTQSATDPMLKSATDFKASNIKRQLYAVVDSIFPLPKGTRGGKVDQMLQAGIEKLKKSGKYDEVFPLQKIDLYNDWQP